MALVDRERAWRDLVAYVASKPHHGSKDLALEMARIEARCHLDESLPEQALRLYGVQLSEDLRAAARDRPPDAAGGSPAGDDSAEPAHRQDEPTQEVNGVNGDSRRTAQV